MKRALVASGLLALAASLAFAADGPPPGSLTAAQVVERNVAARGGLEAWRAVGSLTLAGEMDAGGKLDSRLPFTLTLKRPNKSRLEIRFRDTAALQVYDGSQGWKLRPFLNRDEVEPLSAVEARSAAAASELDGPLVDYARKGSKVELLAKEPVEGHQAYKLRLTLKGGEQMNLWVDASSFLELKIDGEPRRLDGRMHKVSVFYRDFKTVGGLKLPYTFETVVDGVKQTRKMSIQTVTLNPPVPELSFARPQPVVAKAADS